MPEGDNVSVTFLGGPARYIGPPTVPGNRPGWLRDKASGHLWYIAAGNSLSAIVYPAVRKQLAGYTYLIESQGFEQLRPDAIPLCATEERAMELCEQCLRDKGLLPTSGPVAAAPAPKPIVMQAVTVPSANSGAKP